MWWLIGIGVVVVALLVFFGWVAVVTLATVRDVQDERDDDFADDLVESEWESYSLTR